MKKGFTIVEVAILFVIFLIVAFLVAPISLDDTAQVRNTSLWRTTQTDFENIFSAAKNTIEENPELDFDTVFNNTISTEIKNSATFYNLKFLDGKKVNKKYTFDDYKTTYSNATIASKFFEEPDETGQIGLLMYDVNGKNSPNVWGKDVFGFNIYKEKLEPFCKNVEIIYQKQDCSRHGSGVCCSNYYLIGGSFDD